MAAYTWVGTTSNWSTGSNWSPAAPAGGPTSADTATINNSAPCNVTANSSCLTLVFTGYTSTFTINSGFTLTVFGTAITLASGMTYDQTTTGILSTVGNQTAITITFAGITIPNLTLGKIASGTTQTVTISGTTPTIKKLIIANQALISTVALTGTAITITSSFSITQGQFSNSTGQIIFSGTCTINCNASNNTISGGFNVTTGSSLQMLSNIYLGSGTVTFTGTATLNASTFTLFCSTAITFNTSTINWYNISFSINTTHTLSSALNISNNLLLAITGTATFTGGFPINVGGSIIGAGSISLGTSTINLIGAGTVEISGGFGTGTININGTGTYTFGSVSYPTTSINTIVLNLVGTSVAQVYSTVNHNLNITNSTLTTNNTATGANIVGGSEILWGNIVETNANATITLTYETKILGNFSGTTGTVVNGAKLYIEGNLTVNTSLQGTTTIELNGSVNKTWGAGTYQNNITINKTSGAVVTITGSVTWGTVGRTLLVPASQTLILSAGLTLNGGTFNCSAGIFTPGVQTVTVNAVATNINMGSTNKFYNLSASATGAIITMLSKIDVTNNLTLAGTSQMNGIFDITVEGNLTTGGGTVSNSTAGRKLTLKGTATSVSTVTNFQSSNIQLEIDCVTRGFALTGIISIASLNYLATNVGSFTTTGSTLSYSFNSSINMNGSTNSWNIVNNLAGSSKTLILLSSDLYCVQFGPTSNGDIINSSGGSFFIITTGNTAAMSNISGTGGLRFVGASNTAWNQTAATSNSMRTIEFAKTLPGTVSIPNSFTYTGILKYVSGAVTHADTLTLGTGSTVDTTSAVPWNNITIAAGATITINSLLLINGILTLSGATTFAGTAGWDCNNLICSTAGTFNITLQQLITYRTRTGVSITGGTSGLRPTMTSSGASNAIWTLDFGATQSLIYVNGIRIDSSGGQTVWSFGVLPANIATTINWNPGVPLRTVAYTFVN